MCKGNFLVAMFVLLTIGCTLAQQPEPISVEGGRLQGISENGLTVYRGIPFAAPPVGELRWRPPQPAAKWDGIRQAAEFAPGPIQGGTALGRARIVSPEFWTGNPQTTASRYSSGSMAAVLAAGPPPNEITAVRIWPKKV